MSRQPDDTGPRQPGITAEAVAEDVFIEVLRECVDAVEAAGIDYVLMGGFASAAHGRDRWTHDIDFFVKPEDARPVLDVLAERGFATEETDQDWIYKAFRKGVLVDVIFCSADDIYLDDDMLAHAHQMEHKGVRMRVIAPEDLLVIKARVFKEETPRHWFDALGIIRSAELDWDYMVARTRDKPDKPLSVLLFARASGLPVPQQALQKLWDAAAKRSARGERPDGGDEYLTARIHEALAEAGNEIDVCMEEGRIVLAGEAATRERAESIVATATRLAGGHEVVDRVHVTELAEPEEVEQLS